MVLPPGPMSRPIFSGLIFTVSSRGACSLMSAAGLAERREHRLRGCSAGFPGLLQRRLDDLLVDAVDLEVELDAGDALGRCRRS